MLAGHRYYQPQTRRWVNRDPIGYDGGINLYEYSGNDPVNEADPNGTSPAGAFGLGVLSGFGEQIWGVLNPDPRSGPLATAIKLGMAVHQYGAGRVGGALAQGIFHSYADAFDSSVSPYERGKSTSNDITAVAGLVAGGAELLQSEDSAAEESTEAEELTTLANCFVAGTLVQMADGTTKPIEQVKAGDEVASRDPATGKNEAEPVVATDTHLTAQIMTVSLSDGERLDCTPVHRFYVEERGFIDAGKLDDGDVLEYGEKYTDGSGGYEPLTLTVSELNLHPEATSLAAATRVYNFTVEDTHTYFVGTIHHGVWVHNEGAPSTVRLSDLNPTHAIDRDDYFRGLLSQIRAKGIRSPLKYAEHEGSKYIVDGHHRYHAAKVLGILHVPVQRVELPYGQYNTYEDLLRFDPGR